MQEEFGTDLDEKLGLDPPTSLALPLSTCPRQGIDLVDKDDGRFTLPRHLEQLLDQSVRPSQRSSSAEPMTGTTPGSRRTDRSDSPIHLLTRSLELTLKNVLFASVATAFAKKLFPVPGGP